MWQMVRDLGFDGGRVLEPGCGSGTVLGMAPEDLDIDAVGVELDPISAGIAAELADHLGYDKGDGHRRSGRRRRGHPS